jgi:hypothetical protein
VKFLFKRKRKKKTIVWLNKSPQSFQETAVSHVEMMVSS